MPKALISDELSPHAAKVFTELGVDVDVTRGLSLKELLNIIGDIGRLSSKHGINIATSHLGRREAGGEAIALVEIDGGLPESILPKIRGLDQVERVDSLQFAPLRG